MTENGDPYENAIAERVNGILKYEHGLKDTFSSYAQAVIAAAVRKYNELRILDSAGRLMAMMAHKQNGILKKYWKSKVYRTKEEDSHENSS